MYRFVIIFIVCVSVSADNKVNLLKCLSILDLDSQDNCCKTYSVNKTTLMEDNIKECKLMPNVPGSCEKALCFGTKLGIATADGTLNMETLQKHIEDKLSDHKDILVAIKEKCSNDKCQIYGEPDDCDLIKMGNCIRWQYLFRCPELSEHGKCQKIKDVRDQCLELND